MKADATTILRAAAGLLLLLAFALFVIPPTIPGAADAAESAPDFSSLTSEIGALERSGGPTEGIVTNNVFSPGREAPPQRYVPPGMVAATATTPPTTTQARRPTLRLFGIVASPDGSVALIDGDPATPGAEIYRVGDVVQGGRLRAITDSTVVIDGPSGVRVLRLPDNGGSSS